MKLAIAANSKISHSAFRVPHSVRVSIVFAVCMVFHAPLILAGPVDDQATEILKATGGKIDAFVTGVGTGGTITGVGEVLKQHDPNILIVAVEPAASPVLSGGKAGLTGIQGIGASFVPSVLNRDIYDELMVVTDEEAYEMTLRLTKEEGLLVGISSGANVHASLQVAAKLGTGKRIVTTLCDTGERYLSVNL